MPNTVIQLKKSSTPSSIPSDLANGELAINFADGKLFYKNTAGFIAEISGGGGSDSFSTINANGTLVVADDPNDVLTLIAGSNINIVGDAINDTITISATGGSGNDDIAIAAFDKANSAQTIAIAAFDKANTGTTGSAEIAILDEGVTLTNTVTSINFTGSGVTASNTGNAITVNIPGGGGGGSSIETEIVSGTTQTAVKDYRYVLANSSATTLTLPSSPSLGDTLYILVANDLANNTVDRNGLKIMGVEEDLTLDIENISIGLVYINSTLGWRII
jgi:hypothetical protein